MTTDGATLTSRYAVRARFADTDLMGIVHHARYLEYFEAGRVAYMQRRGLDYRAWVDRGAHLPVVDLAVRFRRPIEFDQLLIVETTLAESSRATLRFTYRLLRGERAEVCAEGHTLLCCVGDDRAPRRIPPDLLERLRAAETHPAPEDRV